MAPILRPKKSRLPQLTLADAEDDESLVDYLRNIQAGNAEIEQPSVRHTPLIAAGDGEPAGGVEALPSNEMVVGSPEDNGPIQEDASPEGVQPETHYAVAPQPSVDAPADDTGSHEAALSELHRQRASALNPGPSFGELLRTVLGGNTYLHNEQRRRELLSNIIGQQEQDHREAIRAARQDAIYRRRTSGNQDFAMKLAKYKADLKGTTPTLGPDEKARLTAKGRIAGLRESGVEPNRPFDPTRKLNEASVIADALLKMPEGPRKDEIRKYLYKMSPENMLLQRVLGEETGADENDALKRLEAEEE